MFMWDFQLNLSANYGFDKSNNVVITPINSTSLNLTINDFLVDPSKKSTLTVKITSLITVAISLAPATINNFVVTVESCSKGQAIISQVSYGTPSYGHLPINISVDITNINWTQKPITPSVTGSIGISTGETFSLLLTSSQATGSSASMQNTYVYNNLSWTTLLTSWIISSYPQSSVLNFAIIGTSLMSGSFNIRIANNSATGSLFSSTCLLKNSSVSKGKTLQLLPNGLSCNGLSPYPFDIITGSIDKVA